MSRPAVLITEDIRREELLRVAADALGPECAVHVWDTAAPLSPHGAEAQAEALIAGPDDRIDADVIGTLPRLRVVAVAGEHTDNVDLSAATRAGAAVVRAPVAADSAAERTVAQLLAVARHTPAAGTAGSAGTAGAAGGVELAGKVLGVIGLGPVGERVAARMSAFGMHVLAHDPSDGEGADDPAGGEDTDGPAGGQIASLTLVGLDELLRRSDFLTVHTPVVGARELGLAKPGTRLVDAVSGGGVSRGGVSRGGVSGDGISVDGVSGGVDEAALLAALDEGRVAAAAATGPALAHHPSVVTPPPGAATVEARRRATSFAADAARRALAGEPTPGAVNLPVGAVPEAVRPWLALAARLGHVAGVLAGGSPRAIDVERGGPDAGAGGAALRIAALTGALGAGSGAALTPVEAVGLAAERGCEAEFRPSADPQPVLRTRVVGGEGNEVSLAASLDEGTGEHRLTEVDGMDADLVLGKHLVVLRCADGPGVLGRVAGTLADAGVDILAMQVVRGDGDAAAPTALLTVDAAALLTVDAAALLTVDAAALLTVDAAALLTVDAAVSDEVLDRVVRAAGARHGWAFTEGGKPRSRPFTVSPPAAAGSGPKGLAPDREGVRARGPVRAHPFLGAELVGAHPGGGSRG
ncbi:NAD(P)-dependent oxidoreductase [Streptomyces sp. NPDC041068]|uniref:NAD(P)-dependent oxidoreductase n=1 Tax=Streptomyces sp. NPDC041068 TaxID=3155130 RepID=UPI00340FA2F2